MDCRKRERMQVCEQVRADETLYLGRSVMAEKKKRPYQKPSQKFRFCFDWPISDDTSGNAKDKMSEAPLLFGRGFRAGIDRLEQIRKRQKYVRSNPSQYGADYVSSSTARHHEPDPQIITWREKTLADMTSRDWRILQEDFDISYKGRCLHVQRPRPIRTWEESGLTHDILKAVYEAGYKQPTPIQMASIPVSLAHLDSIGTAKTGSGKTAAFVLPMLNHISSFPAQQDVAAIDANKDVQGPHALVLVPTRELAQQIKEETEKLARHLSTVRIVLIVGGHSVEEQGMELSQGCDIVIATPGRLLDCLERRFVVLNQCSHIVLDEADRMVSMGFEEQLVGVLNALPVASAASTNMAHRTMCMFSATMPNSIERLARRYLSDPVIISVGKATQASDLVTQQVVMVRDWSQKIRELKVLLDANSRDKPILVFVNSRESVNKLVRQLVQREGYRVCSLHGGMPQEQREMSLKELRSAHCDCLVATDVLGRGIDIQGLSHVVIYEMPDTIEKYIHRIGRTGRANQRGFATTFLDEHLDAPIFFDLKQLLIQSNSKVPPRLACHEASKEKPPSF